jgi:methylglyoxal synthase
VKALLGVVVVRNIAIACNRATADFVMSSPLMDRKYVPSFTSPATDTAETAAP